MRSPIGKWFYILACAFGAVVLAAGVASAAAHARTHEKTFRATGVVKAINADNHTMQVVQGTRRWLGLRRGKNVTVDYALASDVKVLKGKASGALTDVTPGEKVAVLGVTAGKEKTVREITVVPVKAPRHKAHA